MDIQIIFLCLFASAFAVDVETDKKHIDWKWRSSDCTDVMISQGSVSYNISSTPFLLPNRPLAVIDCKNEYKNSKIKYNGLKFEKKKKYKLLKKTVAIYWAKDDSYTEGEFVSILDVQIFVLKAAQVPALIMSNFHMVNVLDKEEFIETIPQEYTGVFSYKSDIYKEAFLEYANLSPFTTTILGFVIPLGSLVADSNFPFELPFEQITQARELPGIFIDYDFCGTHRNHNDDEDDEDDDELLFCQNESLQVELQNRIHSAITQHLNSMMTDLDDHSFRKTNTVENGIINRIEQLPEELKTVCCFALADDTNAFVGTTVDDVLPMGKKTDNELPHELGHTFGLPDYAGPGTYKGKRVLLGAQRKKRLIEPYRKDGGIKTKRGAMNGGNKNYIFSQYSEFEYKKMFEQYFDWQTPYIDSRIEINSNKDLRSIIVTLNYKTIHMWQVNIHIPSISSENKKGHIVVYIYNKNGIYKEFRSHLSLFIFPAKLYSKIPVEDLIFIVHNLKTGIWRYFFITNDVLVPPRVFAPQGEYNGTRISAEECPPNFHFEKRKHICVPNAF